MRLPGVTRGSAQMVDNLATDTGFDAGRLSAVAPED